MDAASQTRGRCALSAQDSSVVVASFVGSQVPTCAALEGADAAVLLMPLFRGASWLATSAPGVTYVQPNPLGAEDLV
jgi:hypothetical protein